VTNAFRTIFNGALKKAVRPEWIDKVFVLNCRICYPGMIPFLFRVSYIRLISLPKRQAPADLQTMIDEWVTLLTNEHVGVVLSFIPSGFNAMISSFKALT
jgi:hypothetical protein